MRTSWMIKCFRFSLNRRPPTTNDIPPEVPFAWIDTKADRAYMCVSLSDIDWIDKAPDSITDEDIRVIDTEKDGSIK